MEQNKITQVHGVSSEELKQDFKYIVRAEFKEFALNFQPIIPPEYLTRQEVAVILKVSLVTLSDWNKKRILNPYRLGNLIRYKRSEIEQALICINPKKAR
jgi:excisionase family DNA binding protein